MTLKKVGTIFELYFPPITGSNELKGKYIRYQVVAWVQCEDEQHRVHDLEEIKAISIREEEAS